MLVLARSLSLLLGLCWLMPLLPAQAQTVRQIGGGNFGDPAGVVVDPSGDLFIVDVGTATVKQVPAAGGYASVQTLPASRLVLPTN
jgi:hypothetical protein